MTLGARRTTPAPVFRRRRPRIIIHRAFAGTGWRARYDPTRNEVHVRFGAGTPPRLRAAVLRHELAHWIALVTCRPPACSRYRGEHGRRFYSVLARLHRTSGAHDADAREVERRSGYMPPAAWPGRQR